VARRVSERAKGRRAGAKGSEGGTAGDDDGQLPARFASIAGTE